MKSNQDRKVNNILIIGPGKLGGQIAYHTLKIGVAESIYLIGRDYSRTLGTAQDLKEAFPNRRVFAMNGFEVPEPVELTFFTFSSLQWSPNLGVNDRWIEGVANLTIIDEIAAKINPALLGTILVISNPVDVLTWHASTKLSTSNVFGVGISLDEYRIGATLQRLFGIRCSHVPCIGEHGSKVVPLLSNFFEKKNLSIELYSQVRKETFTHTAKIVRQASIPFYGPLREIERILDILLNSRSGTLTLSRYLDKGVLGIKGVALGVPIEVKNGILNGIGNIIANELEAELFRKASLQVLENYNLAMNIKDDGITALNRGH